MDPKEITETEYFKEKMTEAIKHGLTEDWYYDEEENDEIRYESFDEEESFDQVKLIVERIIKKSYDKGFKDAMIKYRE